MFGLWKSLRGIWIIVRELRLDFDESFLTYVKLFVSKNHITIAQGAVEA